MGQDRRAPSLTIGAIFGAMWTAAMVAATALISPLFGSPNAAYLLFETVTRRLPGAVITFGIDTMLAGLRLVEPSSTAEAAKSAEKALAVVTTVVAGAFVGLAIAAVARGLRRSPIAVGIGAGCLVMIVPWLLPETTTHAPGIGLIALSVCLIAWGALIGLSVSAGQKREETDRVGRRRSLRLLAVSAVGFTSLAIAARWLGKRATRTRRAAAPAVPEPDDVLDGTRPALTSNDDFYRVDINLDPPRVDAKRWRLELGGLVAKPMSLSLDDLRALPAVTRTITLECISNPVGGDLISTARWTGFRLGDLLREAGVKEGARAIDIRSTDGFHESASLEDATGPDSLLVYEMNGEPLPAEHGFPLRIYMPGRHGMKLPKWIERIDLVDEIVPGYWVERGWSREARVHTTSVIDTVDTSPGESQIEMSAGGIAFAGDRGISKVEVRVDEGPWRRARLLEALGPLTWVQWRYDGTVEPGEHQLYVRAYDGTGERQDAQMRPTHPDGATGIDSMVFTA